MIKKLLVEIFKVWYKISFKLPIFNLKYKIISPRPARQKDEVLLIVIGIYLCIVWILMIPVVNLIISPIIECVFFTTYEFANRITWIFTLSIMSSISYFIYNYRVFTEPNLKLISAIEKKESKEEL